MDLTGYFGSKTGAGVAQAIISQFPPHDTYIETHLGSGAVMRRKAPALRSIGVEIDARAVGAFRCAYPVELHQEDAVTFLRTFDWASAGRALVYADPPYLLETRTSGQRYRYEYTEADHIELLETLRAVPAAVVVSGYPAELYDELLAGWRTVTFQAMTRGGVRTEKLWTNVDPSAGVHWATTAGKNRTDRQRIKRKALRWQRMFRDLPPGERAAVLAALLEVC